jgi:hypothetical protein
VGAVERERNGFGGGSAVDVVDEFDDGLLCHARGLVCAQVLVRYQGATTTSR